MHGLRGLRILIVEDEFLLAAELAEHLEGVGAEVLGPVPSVEQAEKYVGVAEAAVLDINLDGENVFPLADALTSLNIPFVFYSGDSAIVLPERFRYANSLSKPVSIALLADILQESNVLWTYPFGEIVGLLPKLRLSARLLLPDAPAADRLVERTLEHAIAEARLRAPQLSRSDWLNGLMHKILADEGQDILN